LKMTKRGFYRRCFRPSNVPPLGALPVGVSLPETHVSSLAVLFRYVALFPSLVTVSVTVSSRCDEPDEGLSSVLPSLYNDSDCLTVYSPSQYSVLKTRTPSHELIAVQSVCSCVPCAFISIDCGLLFHTC